jgi:hypothetical protein
MKHGLYSNCTTPSGTMRCHLYSGTKQQMDALRDRIIALDTIIETERAARGETPDEYTTTYTIEELSK